MAVRRMFSLKILDTDNFLAMPTSARLLYCDLAMRADDDGFVDSPKKIMKMTGASEDDLKVLEAKNYIFPFESGICVIRDWRVHNYIQKDRYQPTIYKQELNQLGIDENGMYTKCIQNVSNLETQVRLGEVSLGKDRVDNSIAPPEVGAEQQQLILDVLKKENIPYQQIIDLYHQHLGNVLTKVKILSEQRKKLIKARCNNELPTLERWDIYFQMVKNSDFLMGRTLKPFYADIDWLINSSNCIKVLEHKYSNGRLHR